MDKPMNAPARTQTVPRVAQVQLLRPLHWIELGWKDLSANPGPSLAHGLILVAVGWLILLLCSTHIDLLAAVVSGFLLVGPVFGAGFYELSRRRAANQPASFDASLDGALRNARSLVRLGLLLAALGAAWVATSHWLFRREFGGDMPAVDMNLYRTILDWQSYGFLVNYIGTGAIYAAAVFIVCVVSAPMIFDRAADTRTAIRTSVRAVAVNPAAMLVWAVLIAAFTAVGFATFLVGLVIVLPLLGHATWHAYRDLVR
jgi:uncharacterized membrane protein